MRVYKRNPLDIDLGGMEGWIVPLIAGIIIIVLVLLLLGNVSAPVLSATLAHNPISLAANESTILQVQVSNPTAQMGQNLIVQVSAPSAPQLSLTPSKQTIAFLGTNETRNLEFLVIPIDGQATPFTPGTYTILISTQLNGKPYQLQVPVTISK
jgi:hypothetical protein